MQEGVVRQLLDKAKIKAKKKDTSFYIQDRITVELKVQQNLKFNA